MIHFITPFTICLNRFASAIIIILSVQQITLNYAKALPNTILIYNHSYYFDSSFDLSRTMKYPNSSPVKYKIQSNVLNGAVDIQNCKSSIKIEEIAKAIIAVLYLILFPSIKPRGINDKISNPTNPISPYIQSFCIEVKGFHSSVKNILSL